MDFTLDETQAMLADSVDRFIAGDYDFETRQRIAASDSGYSLDVWRKFAELGWLALPFPERDGGFDGGPLETMILMQAFGRGLVVEPYLANVVLAGGILRRLANHRQREAWLIPLISGELQTALAFVEPQARYELADVATKARPDGTGWRLSGTKGVVLNGGNAELLIVPARTDGGRRDADGITLFAVDAAAEGIAVRRYPTVDGAQAAEIVLDDVRAEADALLGDVGRGLEALEAAVEDATLAVCAEAVGIMQTLTEKTVAYSKSRIQFGVPIGSFQALQHRMVDMLTACEQSYSLLLWATSKHAGGGDSRRAVSSMKYQVGTAGRQVGQEAVQIHGAMGVTWELDVAHYFKRLTTIGQIFGNADWHLDRVAA
jgi:alkylation response protein AidB-like acyl-CoA dehydrogenase